MNVRGERVIIFGDSLSHNGSDNAPEIWDVDQGSGRISGQPGDLLASLLKEQGAEAVRVNARVSRSAPNFFSRENSQALFNSDAQFRPTKVVVILGTNDLHINRGTDEEAMRKIVGFYQGLGAEVWGVGPFMYTSDRLNQEAEPVVEMQRQIFGGRFVDPRPITAVVGRASDGVHFGGEAARITALGLADLLLSTKAPGNWMPLAVGAAIVVGLGLFWSRWRQKKLPMLSSSSLGKTLGAIKISKVDPATMTAAPLNKELDKLDAERERLNDLLIEAGRGSETSTETYKKTDPLSREWRAIVDRSEALHNEISLRCGPGAPSRMPPGFKPRKKAPTPEEKRTRKTERQDLENRRAQLINAMGYAGNTRERVDQIHADIDEIDAKLRELPELHGLGGLGKITDVQTRAAQPIVTEGKKALKELEARAADVDEAFKNLKKAAVKASKAIDAKRAALDESDAWDPEPIYSSDDENDDDRETLDDHEDVAELLAKLQEISGPDPRDLEDVAETFNDWKSNLRRLDEAIADAQAEDPNLKGLGKLGAKEDPKVLFKQLLLDPDPASMETAQDLLLEHEIKLSKISSTYGDSGKFVLKAGQFAMLNTEIGWQMWPGDGNKCTGEIATWIDGERVMWPMERGRAGRQSSPEDRLEMFYNGSPEFCVRATVADAWATAKAVKQTLASNAYENADPELRKGKLRNAIGKAINKDNSEPSELYGLKASNVDIETVARDIEREGRPGAAEMAAEVRKQATPYRRLGVRVKARHGGKFEPSDLHTFQRGCRPAEDHTRPAFCELKNVHRLADGSILARVRMEPYGNQQSIWPYGDAGSTWLLHFENKGQMGRAFADGAVIDYRLPSARQTSQTKRGRREPSMKGLKNANRDLKPEEIMIAANDAALEHDYARALEILGQREIPKIATAFKVITPESAEDGDYAEQGWDDEDGDPIEIDDDDLIDEIDKRSTKPVTDAIAYKAAKWRRCRA